MLIDWFTVTAQILNFLVLVWLMKRFLYQPILNAVDAREKLIAGQLADAEATKAEAQNERDEFQRKNQALEQQRAALFSQADDEAKAEYQRLFAEARLAVETFSAKRQQALQDDARRLNQTISRQTQFEIFAIARKALKELASVSLEEQISVMFIQRLHQLDATTEDILLPALKTVSAPVLVRSAFELSADQRFAIQQAINAMAQAEVSLQFEIAPDLIGGIELTVNGQKLAWSIADYLLSLEKKVADFIQENHKPETVGLEASGQETGTNAQHV